MCIFVLGALIAMKWVPNKRVPERTKNQPRPNLRNMVLDCFSLSKTQLIIVRSGTRANIFDFKINF